MALLGNSISKCFFCHFYRYGVLTEETEGDVFESAVWAVGTPGILHDEILFAPFIVGNADDGHAVSLVLPAHAVVRPDGTLRLDFQGFGRLSAENASEMFASSINEFVPAGTYIENIKGVVLPTSVVDGQQRFPNKPNVVDKLDSVFYLKDVHGELHSIKRGAESSSALQAGDIRLSDGSVDVNAFTGFVTNGTTGAVLYFDNGFCKGSPEE